jgi:hypothetical protein
MRPGLGRGHEKEEKQLQAEIDPETVSLQHEWYMRTSILTRKRCLSYASRDTLLFILNHLSEYTPCVRILRLF